MTKRLIYEVNGSGCHIVTSHSRDRYGYVQFKVKGKNMRAHRWVYEAINGPIQPGMLVRHKCDNRACINPAHLELARQPIIPVI